MTIANISLMRHLSGVLVKCKDAFKLFGLKLINCLLQSVLYLTKLVNKEKFSNKTVNPADRPASIEKRQLLVIIRKVFLSLHDAVDCIDSHQTAISITSLESYK